jgi:ABC-type multidrug transport system fused ATPase/permease subunit
MKETWRELTGLISFFTRPAVVVATVLAVVVLMSAEVVATAACLRSMTNALVSRTGAVIWGAGLGLVSLTILRMLLVSWWRSRRVLYAGELAANLRKALMNRTFSLGTEQAEQLDPGKFSSWATSDIETASQLVEPGYLAVLYVSQAMAATVCMVLMDWKLGALCALTIPLIGWVSGRLSAPMSALGQGAQESYARISSFATDALANSQVIRVFGLEPEVTRRFHLLNSGAYAVNRTLVAKSAALEGAIWFFAGAPLAIPFIYGGYLAFHGITTVGTVMAVVNLSNYTRAPLAELGSQLGRIRRSLGGGREVVRFIREPDDRRAAVSCARCQVEATGAMNFERLSFRYHGADRDTLDDVSLLIAAGSCTVIVGESGSGKTTLLKVIAGLYPVTSTEAASAKTATASAGTTTAGGASAGVALHAAPANLTISYVPQDPFLFPWSIRDNLLLGRRDPSADLDGAIRAACAEFVYDLPGGLDTVISKDGTALSGGEKARIGLARALLADPDVLLLDEPGASLDAHTEETLWQRLRARMAGKTMVVVTHRLSELRPSDALVVLDRGRIAGAEVTADVTA